MLQERGVISTTVDPNQERILTPTLMIGLGGSGKEVLLRIRKLFHERHANLQNIPIIRFLWIDTDVQNEAIMHEDIRQYPLLEQIMFKDTEKMSINISQEFWQEYWQWAHQGRYQHISEWLSESIQSAGDSLVQDAAGAGQIRQYGRLCFFNHFKPIQQKVQSELQALYRNEAIKTKTLDYFRQRGYSNCQIDNAVHVVVVCSLVGGTGSSIFLDVPFMIKDLSVQKRIDDLPKRIGVAVLPALFTQFGNAQAPIDSINAYANAYAALSELEYYSTRRLKNIERREHCEQQYGRFDVTWDPEQGHRQIEGPPYDLCYLIDNIYNMERYEIFDMIAEALYLDYEPTPFGVYKRSTRNNSLANALHKYMEDQITDRSNQVTYSRLFSRRYSSFGLSRISVDQEKVRQIAAYCLCARLLQHWLYSSEHTKTPLESSKRKQTAEKLMQEAGLDYRKYHQQLRDSIWSQIVQNCGKMCDHEELSQWCQQIERSLQNGACHQKLFEIRQKIQNGIAESISSFFNKAFQQYGCRIAYEMLADLKEITQTWKQDKDEQKLTKARSQYEKYLDYLQQAEGLRFPLKKLAIREELPKAQKAAIRMLHVQLEQDVLSCITALANTIEQRLANSGYRFFSIQGNNCSYDGLFEQTLRRLEQAHKFFNDSYERLKKPRESRRNFWLLDDYDYHAALDEKLLEQYEHRNWEDSKEKRQVIEEEKKLLREFLKEWHHQDQMSLVALMELLSLHHQQGLQKELLKFTIQYLCKSGFANGHIALELLDQKTGGNWNAKAVEVARYSKVYLKINKTIPGRYQVPMQSLLGQQSCTIGERILQIDTALLSSNTVSAEHTHDSILFYSEVSAIPICIIDHFVEQYYRNYLESAQGLGLACRHITKEYRKFPNLTLLTPEEISLRISVTRLLLQGIMLYDRDVSESNQTDRRPIIFYDEIRNRRGFFSMMRPDILSPRRPQFLGGYLEDVEESLSAHQDYYEDIRERLRFWEYYEHISEEELFQYLALLNHYKEEVFPQYRNQNGDEESALAGICSPEHTIISNIFTEIQEYLLKKYPSATVVREKFAPYLKEFKTFSFECCPTVYPKFRSLKAPKSIIGKPAHTSSAAVQPLSDTVQLQAPQQLAQAEELPRVNTAPDDDEI